MLNRIILYIVLAITQGQGSSIREDLVRTAEKYKRECTGDSGLDAFYRDETAYLKRCSPLELELQRLQTMSESLAQ
jgi:hypothetical protein